MRASSDAGRTRIVIEFDEPAQYQAQYTSTPSISVCLPETGLGDIKRTVRINDDLVEAITLKEIMGNTVDVNVSLRRHASFTIFPLESPDRIVIDVMSSEASPSHETIGIGIGKLIDKPTVSAAGTDPKPANRLKSLLPFQFSKSVIARLCFDALLVISLIIMAISLWRVSRISKKDPAALKKYQTFADMVNKNSRFRRKRERPTSEQHLVTVKAAAAEKHHKRREKKRDGIGAASTQKQYRKVHELAQLGMDPLAISRQSNVPIGEVNLILDLSKVNPGDKPN